MPSPLSIGLVAVALVAGSCSGTGEGDDPTAPTTTAPSTTVVATTAAPTTLAATTLAPTTTIDPIEAERAAVAAAVVQARAASTAVYRNPNDPAAIAALDLSYVPGGEARAVIEADLAVLAEQGWEVRPNPDVADGLTVEAVELLDGPPATRALVTACIIDPDIVLEPGAGPNGEDTIVNDVVFAYRSTLEMVLGDGTWRLLKVTTLQEWTGELACPA